MNIEEMRQQLLITLLIAFVAILISAFKMPEKMPSFKWSFLSRADGRFRHIDCSNVL